MRQKKFILSILSFVTILFGALFINIQDASATIRQLGFSPIRTNIVLVPGTTNHITVTLFSAYESEAPTEYELEFRPFYFEDENDARFEAKGSYSQIVDWISFNEEDMSGVIKPNASKRINFTITAPENAPAGGQYAALVIKTHDNKDNGIRQVFETTHIIYAEVSGETHHQGEITSLTLPGFLLSGKITGTAAIKNLGNVHSNAKHILSVYPLFSNEEIYTNEEEPYESLIMPEATRQSSVSWDETPSVGIFRVKYTVEFEGVKNELEKIVIVCPLWLLIIIFLFIVVLIYRIVTGAKKKPAAKPAEA